MFEIQQLSAGISALITRFALPCARVLSFEAPNKLIMTSSPPTSPANFFPPTAQLSSAEKQRLYLRYARSFGCQDVVLLYAIGLKQLIDSGIPLSHKTNPVVDIWILNTDAFPVDDLHESALLLEDAKSGVSVSTFSTYHNMKMMRTFGTNISDSFGCRAPERFNGPPEASSSFRNTLPHWWLAFLVNASPRKDKDVSPNLKLIHVDLCGAAYSDDGFHRHNGEIVSLHIFESPPYIIQNSRLSSQSDYRRVSHMFRVTSLVRTPSGKEVRSLMSESMRHLRCLHSDGPGTLEMTPLPSFVHKTAQGLIDLGQWRQQVAELRDSMILDVQSGTAVRLCGLKKRTELNGRVGRVYQRQDARKGENSFGRGSEERISVKVPGLSSIVRLRPECVRIDPLKQQYRTVGELSRETGAFEEQGLRSMKKEPGLSGHEMRECRMLMSDPEVVQVMENYESGNVVVSNFLDDAYVRGVRKLLRPPLRKLFQDDFIESFRDVLSIVEHAKGKEALRIIKMLVAAKTKMIEENPETLQAGGSVAVERGGKFHRLLQSVARKIEEDEALSEVFSKIDERSYFPNPVKLAAYVSNLRTGRRS